MLRTLSLILGPIFAKEMVEIARRKRYYFNRVLYGAVLLFTLYVVYENHRFQLQSAKPSIRMQADVAQGLFHAVSVVQFGAAFLLVPLFVAGVIASEREERTLELLFTTALRDRQIVLGKLASRAAVLILLILCGLPVISLVMFFGGIDPVALWRILWATMLAIVYAGAHAIYFSTTTKSPMGAVVRSYWWMALWLFALPMAVLIPLEALRLYKLAPWAAAGFAFLNPIGCFVLAMDVDGAYREIANHIDQGLELLTGIAGWNLGEWFFPFTFVLPLAWSSFLVWRAVARLRHEPKTFTAWIRSLHLPGRTFRRRVASRLAAWRRARAARFCYLFRVRNPLWLRSRMARVYDRENVVGRIQLAGWAVAGFFVLLLLLVEPRDLSENGACFGFLVPTWIAVAALLAIVSGSSLVGDRRRGFLDLVLMTPLTAREVLDGAFLSVWEHIRRLYWLPWVLGLFFYLTGSTYLIGLTFSILTGTLFGALLLWHGLACSLTARTAAGALVPTFMMPIIVIVGLPFFIVIFRHDSGPVLWVLIAILFVITWFWARRSTSAAAVGSYFIAMHLVAISLLSCWTVFRGGEEYPVAGMCPAFLVFAPLGVWPTPWLRETIANEIMLACYWAALFINLLWARWWLIRHFDRLVERAVPTLKTTSRYALRSTRSRALPSQQAHKVQTFEPTP